MPDLDAMPRPMSSNAMTGPDSRRPAHARPLLAMALAGQTAFLRDVVSAVAAVPNGRGLGVVWWYPEAIQVPGVFIWGGGSMALFDAGCSLLPAASMFTP